MVFYWLLLTLPCPTFSVATQFYGNTWSDAIGPHVRNLFAGHCGKGGPGEGAGGGAGLGLGGVPATVSCRQAKSKRMVSRGAEVVAMTVMTGQQHLGLETLNSSP